MGLHAQEGKGGRKGLAGGVQHSWAGREGEEVSRLGMGSLCGMGKSWEFFTSPL